MINADSEASWCFKGLYKIGSNWASLFFLISTDRDKQNRRLPCACTGLTTVETRRKSGETQSPLLHMCRIAQAFFHSSLRNNTLNLETGGWLYRTHGREVTFPLCMKNHVELKRGRDLDIRVVSVRSMFCPPCHPLRRASGPRSSDQPGVYRLNDAKFTLQILVSIYRSFQWTHQEWKNKQKP